MSTLQNIVGILIIAAGLIFILIGSIGLVRLPDFYSRTHAASKVDTVGISVVIFGVAVIHGFNLDSAKILLAAIFLMFANPVAAHALGRAAHYKGLKPWRRPADNPPQPKT